METAEVLGRLVLDTLRNEYINTGRFSPMFLIRKADGSIEHERIPKEAEHLMNIGRAKDIIFSIYRKRVKRDGLTAVVFGTSAWTCKSTDKAHLMGHAALTKLSLRYSTEELEKMGLFTRTDTIVASAHTPDLVVMLSQEVIHDQPIRFGEVEVLTAPADEFVGRQKMFGDLQEENLR